MKGLRVPDPVNACQLVLEEVPEVGVRCERGTDDEVQPPPQRREECHLFELRQPLLNWNNLCQIGFDADDDLSGETDLPGIDDRCDPEDLFSGQSLESVAYRPVRNTQFGTEFGQW